MKRASTGISIATVLGLAATALLLPAQKNQKVDPGLMAHEVEFSTSQTPPDFVNSDIDEAENLFSMTRQAGDEANAMTATLQDTVIRVAAAYTKARRRDASPQDVNAYETLYEQGGDLADAYNGKLNLARIAQGMLSGYVRDHRQVGLDCRQPAIADAHAELCGWIGRQEVAGAVTKAASRPRRAPASTRALAPRR